MLCIFTKIHWPIFILYILVTEIYFNTVIIYKYLLQIWTRSTILSALFIIFVLVGGGSLLWWEKLIYPQHQLIDAIELKYFLQDFLPENNLKKIPLHQAQFFYQSKFPCFFLWKTVDSCLLYFIMFQKHLMHVS